MPLTLPQIVRLQSSRDPETVLIGEALNQLVQSHNALAANIGADPNGVFPTPQAIGSLTVTAANGLFDAAIIDASVVGNPKQTNIEYFLEYSSDPNFINPPAIVVPMGASRNIAHLFLGSRTLYFRAYSQYLNSQPSAKVTFGIPPTAVVGGGAIAGPTPNASQGSGSANAGTPGSGFGINTTLSK